MTSATLPYVTGSVVSTTESVQNSSATVDNNDNGYQKVVITVGVMVGAIIIAFIVAKIVDYCYDHTIAHRDDASDISEHTRNLIRARLVVSQFQKKVNNDATDEEKEVERQKKVLRIWSEKGKLSRKIADQRRTEDQKKQTVQRHDLFTIMDRATDDRKIASTLQRAAASLLVVSETHPVNRSPGIRRIKRTVLGFDSAPLDSGSANPAPKISIVVTDFQDGHPPPASSLDSSAPNTSDDHRVPENYQSQAAPENSEGVLFQTHLDDVARPSGVDTVEGPNPPAESDFTSRERNTGQGPDQTAFPLNGQAGLTQVTEDVDSDVKGQAPNPDQFSDASFAPQEKETTLTIAGTKGNNLIKNSNGPHGTPGTLLSRKGPTMVLPTVVTSQPEERVRRAQSAKNIKAGQEQSRGTSTHARLPPANVTADYAQLGSTRASSRPAAKNVTGHGTPSESTNNPAQQAVKNVTAHGTPSESTNNPAQQAVKNVTGHGTPSQRTNYVKNVTADHAALRSPSTPVQEKPRPKKSRLGTPSTTSFRTLAKVYRNTMGLTVHRPVTAKTRGQNSVQGSEELARPAENSSKSNQGPPLRVKSAK